MAYGMQIQTTEGFIDVGSLRTVRYLKSYSLSGNTTSSYQTYMPEFNSNNGILYIQRLDSAGLDPDWSFNNSNKILYWNCIPASTPFGAVARSTSFRVITTSII